MASEVQPAAGTTFISETQCIAIEWGGGNKGWIVPDDEELVAHERGASGTPLDAFSASFSSTSFEVTIGSGEGPIRGAYLWTDEETTVELAPDEDDQIIKVGWSDGAGNDVHIDVEGGEEEPDYGLDVWSFDTDSNGVISSDRIQNAGREHARSDMYVATGGGTFDGRVTFESDIDVEGTIRSESNESAMSEIDMDGGNFAYITQFLDASGNPDVRVGADADGEGNDSAFFVRDVSSGDNLLRVERDGTVVAEDGEYSDLYTDDLVVGDEIFADDIIGDNGQIDFRGSATNITVEEQFRVWYGPDNDTRIYVDEDVTEIRNSDLTVRNDLEVLDSEIRMPNASGNEGLQFSNGIAFSYFNSWGTAYAYSDDDAEGFRVRDPDGDGDLFTVESNRGDAEFNRHVDIGGDLDIDGDIESEGTVRVQEFWATLDSSSGTFGTFRTGNDNGVSMYADNTRLRYAPREEGNTMWGRAFDYHYGNQRWEFQDTVRVNDYLYADGDNGVPFLTSSWDGNSLTIEFPNGDEIEFVGE